MNQISHPIVNGPSHTYYVGHILCAIFLQCKYYSFSRTDNLVSFCWIIETFANNFTLLFFCKIYFVLCVVIRHWNSNSFDFFFVFDRLKSIRGLLSIKSNVLQDSHNPASSKSFWLGQSFFVFVVSSSKKKVLPILSRKCYCQTTSRLSRHTTVVENKHFLHFLPRKPWKPLST